MSTDDFCNYKCITFKKAWCALNLGTRKQVVVQETTYSAAVAAEETSPAGYYSRYRSFGVEYKNNHPFVSD